MPVQNNMCRISIIHGDITQQHVDAIVNAANTSLLGGGGVDGAIHRAAGPNLLEECRVLKGCQTGNAKITRGFNLPAQYVIHTVGPIWHGGNRNESVLLMRCYENSLDIAQRHSVSSIAFPSISTGAYRFPIKEASHIALTTFVNFCVSNESIEKIYMVCFDSHTYETYKTTLNTITHEVN